MTIWRIALVSAGVAAAGTAGAAGFRWQAETEKWTPPAGAASGTTVESLVSADYYGLEALRLWDFDGRACALQLEQSSFNAPSLHPLDVVRVCEPKQTQGWQRVDVGSGNFVRAIAVCTALKGSAGQLRGVELWGAAPDANGKLKPAKASVKLELSHCEKWSPRRECPEGSIATGVRALVADADTGAVGLALRCHALGPSQ
jgi:hypothetical protein